MKNFIKTIILTTIITGCKKPYLPPVIASANSYLVVEGVINTNGNDSTVIKLSRSVNLSKGVTTNPVTGAIVTIENDQNLSVPVTEEAGGTYILHSYSFDNTRKYRLRIKTADNQQYLSDYAAVTITPPVDSIGFTVQNNNLQIYANTHDPKNSTHYYRWDYTETWLFNAEYESGFITNGNAIVGRTAPQLVYTCWSSDNSSTILLGTSAKLSQDVIFQAPITNIVSSSEKIEAKYSILLREYALTSDAYSFWLNLKKNTEQLGSIFDAQPSEIAGNIHNTANAAEPVIGYISACSVQTKRVFITKDQLPGTWQTVYPYACELDTNYYSQPKTLENQVAINLIPIPPIEIPVQAFYPAGGGLTILGYLASSSYCVDCTTRGTKTEPTFWK